MESERQVSHQEGKDFADSLNIPFMETSAKQRINIEDCFKLLTMTILPNAAPQNQIKNLLSIIFLKINEKKLKLKHFKLIYYYNSSAYPSSHNSFFYFLIYLTVTSSITIIFFVLSLRSNRHSIVILILVLRSSIWQNCHC